MLRKLHLASTICGLIVLIGSLPSGHRPPVSRQNPKWDPRMQRNEQDINLNRGISTFLYQGDIAMSPARLETYRRGKRAVIDQKTFPSAKWDLPMPYYFDPNFPLEGRRQVLEAMRYWSEKTCVTFQENRRVWPHVRIYHGSGCWSYVGRQHRLFSQSLSLDDSCTRHLFVVAHELAHALGLYHEHARHDRDQFIDIDYSNTRPNLTFAFNKEDSSTADNLGMAYEYGSVMHYALDQFALNTNRPVIYAKDRFYAQTMGNRMRATFQDVLQMNLLYNCQELCAHTTNRCLHGGYPTPRDCSVCLCPDGFGGRTCNEPEAPSPTQIDNIDCGGILWATKETQTMFGAVRTRVGAQRFLAAPDHCWWHIRAPYGRRIELRIKSIVSPCSMSCSFNALELKVSNSNITGYRFCCDEHIYSDVRSQEPHVFYTDQPLAVVGAFARYDYLEFQIDYQLV